MTLARIRSILETKSLGQKITGIRNFELSDLELNNSLNCELPSNLRLGHLAEFIVSKAIKASNNFTMLSENIQLVANKKTIGELDFLILENRTKQKYHIELAYKFYLLDKSIDKETINCWIGPNRKDSLVQKIEKTKRKQFPLLYNETLKKSLTNLDPNLIEQRLCLLASLYVPFKEKPIIDNLYTPFISGYYLSWEQFVEQNQNGKFYFIPQKKHWGISPSANDTWYDFNDVKSEIYNQINDKRAVLCWEKHKDLYRESFIVWW